MRVVHSERHAAHAYEHEVSGGTPIPAWEVPARAQAILAALTADGHPVSPPTGYGAT